MFMDNPFHRASPMDSSRFLIYLFDLKRFVRFSSRILYVMAKCEQAPFCPFDLIENFSPSGDS